MHAMTVAVDLAKTVFALAVANGQWRLTARHRFNRRQFARFLSTAPATHVVMLRHGPLPGPGGVAARPPGHPRAARLCTAVCPPQQDRPCRCRSAARGGAVGADAECAGQAGRAASARRPASRAGAVDEDPDRPHQHPAWDLARARAVAARRGQQRALRRLLLRGRPNMPGCSVRRAPGRLREQPAQGARPPPRGTSGNKRQNRP